MKCRLFFSMMALVAGSIACQSSSPAPAPVAAKPDHVAVVKSDKPKIKLGNPEVKLPGGIIMVKSLPAEVLDNDPSEPAPRFYRVTAGQLAVRAFPSSKSKMVGYLVQGTKVKGFEIEGDWVRIYENSYVSRHFLQLDEQNVAASAK